MKWEREGAYIEDSEPEVEKQRGGYRNKIIEQFREVLLLFGSIALTAMHGSVRIPLGPTC